MTTSKSDDAVAVVAIVAVAAALATEAEG